jgi:hypothetical protein
MNQLGNPTSLADRLMMGPDGAVYAVHAGTLKTSPPDDLSRASAPNLPQHYSGTGEGGGCFRYSAEVQRRDGGEPSSCFRYSAQVPRRDGGTGSGCFRYSAEVPRRDGGKGSGCFTY